jgi:hypothetical protein
LVSLDKARIERQIRELAPEHAAGRLEDAVYLERLTFLRIRRTCSTPSTIESLSHGGGAFRQALRRHTPTDSR